MQTAEIVDKKFMASAHGYTGLRNKLTNRVQDDQIWQTKLYFPRIVLCKYAAYSSVYNIQKILRAFLISEYSFHYNPEIGMNERKDVGCVFHKSAVCTNTEKCEIAFQKGCFCVAFCPHKAIFCDISQVGTCVSSVPVRPSGRVISFSMRLVK